MTIRDWNPADGDACQGDIVFFRIPDAVGIVTTDEIAPREGRLIIQEGEVSGHHHAIDLPRTRHFRPETKAVDPVLHVRDTRLRKAFADKIRTGIARAYRDAQAIAELRRLGELTRSDLAIGLLVVEGGPVVIGHEEHDGIRVPVGRYYVGRQVESAGAEERVVAD